MGRGLNFERGFIMAYKVDAKQAFNETVIISGRGWKKLKVNVSISTDALVNKAKPLAEALMSTGKAYSAEVGNDETKFKAFTDSLDAMFTFIFGAKTYQKVLKYYDHEYLEMASDLTPFIRDCVIPSAVAAMSNRARS